MTITFDLMLLMNTTEAPTHRRAFTRTDRHAHVQTDRQSVTTKGMDSPDLCRQFCLQQLKQIEVAEVVRTNLALESLLCVAQRARHDPSVAYQNVYPGLCIQHLSELGHTVQVC